MNDPTGSTGRIYPCSSEANLQNAISILDTTVTRATKAVDLDTAGKVSEAFETWDLVFAGSFPAYY
jgi:hypothetical protein